MPINGPNFLIRDFILSGLFAFFVLNPTVVKGQSLKSLHVGANGSADWNIYNTAYRFQLGHDWFKEQKWGIKKSLYLVYGKTSIFSDYPGPDRRYSNPEEIHWGINSLFSVYHRSEKYKFELGAGMGPGVYFNTRRSGGKVNHRYPFISGEFRWYVGTGRMFESWGLQFHSGLVFISRSMQGYNMGTSLFYYY